MEKFYVGLISFAIGMVLAYFLIINSIQVTKIESNGEKINSALVTVDIQGEQYSYYMGE